MLDEFKDFEMSVAAIVNGNGSFEHIDGWVTDSLRVDLERRIGNALNATQLPLNDLSLVIVVKPNEIETLADLYAMKYGGKIKTKYGSIEIIATPEGQGESGIMRFTDFIYRTTHYLGEVIRITEAELNPQPDTFSYHMLELYKNFHNKYLHSLSIFTKKTIN